VSVLSPTPPCTGVETDVALPFSQFYNDLERLCRTSQSDVCAATRICDDARVALKRCAVCGERAFAKQVTMVYRTVGVPNLVEVLDVCTDLDEEGVHLILVLPLLDPVPEDQRWEAMLAAAFDVLGALVELHARGLVHMDVKPSNVMWRPGGGAVLIDHHLVTDCRLPSATLPQAGTPGFMAPEVEEGWATGTACDVFSMGRTISTWLGDTVPSDEVDELVQAMCYPSPSHRPTAMEAREQLDRILASLPAEHK